MAVYQIGQAEYEVDDSIQGQELQGVLSKLKAAHGEQETTSNDILNVIAPPSEPETKDYSFGDKLTGLYETLKTVATGATGGTVGMAAGFLEQAAKEIAAGEFGSREAAIRIEQNSMKRASQLTDTPETEKGLEYLKTVEDITAPLAALPPVMIPEAIAAGIAARHAATRSMTVFDDALKESVKQIRKKRADFGGLSVGAAELDDITKRVNDAKSLDVPIELTRGQATRTFEDQRFEQETAKIADFGEPLRKRFMDQNDQLTQNFDEMIENTDAKAFGLYDIGKSVDSALLSKFKKDKSNIRELYKQAKESGGMDVGLDFDQFADYLNKNRAAREESGILQKTQRQIEALEIGSGDFSDGSLVLDEISLQSAEDLRRFIGNNVNTANRNDLRIGVELKNLIDELTEGKGNEKYKAARASRRKLAKDFEDTVLMKQLLGTKKGTRERTIAFEDVLIKGVLSKSASKDSLKNFKSTLLLSGDEGKQAWKDVQAGVLQYLQDEMLKNVAQNERGKSIASASKLKQALRKLQQQEKLDIIFDKGTATKLEVINDVAGVLLTSPPGTINHSNTATVLAAFMDVAISGTSGIPAPIATTTKMLTNSIKDKKLKAKIKKHLGGEFSQ